jgi:hypothetical protein
MTNDEKIEDLLADHQKYHTDFQMDFLITSRSGVTTFGMYRQALRELKKRHVVGKRHRLKRRLIQERIRLSGEPKTEIEAIRLERRHLDLAEIQECIRHCDRERRRFQEQAETLRAQLGEIDLERKARLERELVLVVLQRKVAISLLTDGRISSNLLDTIASLTVEDAMAVISGVETVRRELKALACQGRLPTPEPNGRLAHASDP